MRRSGLLGVTVLTSMSDHDLNDAGYDRPAAELVGAARGGRPRRRHGRRGGLAGGSGGGARRGRARHGDRHARHPAGRAAADDQKRAATPAAAIRAGADYLVVGRPITTAADPRAAAKAIVAEIERAAMTRSGKGGRAMAKGYWIVRADVTDPAKYDAYRADNAEALSKYGARFLVRGGSFETPEGRRGRATWCSNSPAIRPPSTATIRRSISAPRRTARAPPSSTSSSSKATTGRSREARSPHRPGLL